MLYKKSKFVFKLSYDIRIQKIVSQSSTWGDFEDEYITVEISANEKDTHLSYKVDTSEGIIEKESDIVKRYGSLENIFPSNIVIYYSGLSDIMKKICEPHDIKLSVNYRAGKPNINRPFFYFEPELFDLILISLLSYEFGDIPQFLYEKAKIKGFQSIRIILKKPKWSKGKIDNWWGALGEVKTFLDLLNSKSNNIDNLNLNITKEVNSEGNIILEATTSGNYLNIYILLQHKLFEIREHFDNEKTFFKILNTLYIDGFLNKCYFSFIGDDNYFTVLSEGEQQLITIKGLTELVTGENTLFLFDEPDTFLHPSWQSSFIESLIQFVKSNSETLSQFLITTHSPQLLGNAYPVESEVQIMEDGEIVKLTPKYYGRDISTILYELMGVERRNKKVTKELSNLFSLIDDEELENAKLEYQRLSDLLGVDDPAIIRAKTQLNYLEESKHEANK
jgi:predicted ATPase